MNNAWIALGAMITIVVVAAAVVLIAVGQQGLESSAGRYEIEEKIVNPP